MAQLPGLLSGHTAASAPRLCRRLARSSAVPAAVTYSHICSRLPALCPLCRSSSRGHRRSAGTGRGSPRSAAHRATAHLQDRAAESSSWGHLRRWAGSRPGCCHRHQRASAAATLRRTEHRTLACGHCKAHGSHSCCSRAGRRAHSSLGGEGHQPELVTCCRGHTPASATLQQELTMYLAESQQTFLT